MGGVRRSSRRATIERRVWAPPKKEKDQKFGTRLKISRGKSKSRLNLFKPVGKRKRLAESSDVDSSNSDPPASDDFEPIENGVCDHSFASEYSQDGSTISKDSSTQPVRVENCYSLQNSFNRITDDLYQYNYHKNAAPMMEQEHDLTSIQPKNFANFNHEMSTNSSDTEMKMSICQAHSSLSSPINKSDTLLNEETSNIISHGPNSSESSNFVATVGSPTHGTPLSELDLTDPNVIQSIGMRYPELEVVKIELPKRECSHESKNICAKDEDNHVSLSEALAKLVDSDDSGPGIDSETVTIHPVIVSEADDANGRSHSRLSNISESSRTKDETIASALLSLKSGGRDFFDAVNIPTPENRTQPPSPCQADFCHTNCVNVCEKNEEGSLSTAFSSESDDSNFEASQTPPKQLSQPPPLVRIPIRPPIIKTPLQCSECRMRFCTVRSLLWHFGTHTLKHEEEVSPILLKDLAVYWDEPEVPIKPPCSANELDMTQDFPLLDVSCIANAKPVASCFDAQPIRSNSSCTVNGDFILKVPIPKLKHRNLNYCASVPNNTLTDGAPDHNSKLSDEDFDYLDNNPQKPLEQNSFSSPPVFSTCATLSYSFAHSSHSMNGEKNSITTVTNCHSALPQQFPKVSSEHLSIPQYESSISLPNGSSLPYSKSNENGISNSSPFKPEVSNSFCKMSTQTQTTFSSSTPFPKQVTVIPVEKLGEMKHKLEEREFSYLNSNFDVASKENQNLFEKDGLVMINQNLALRIVSSQLDSSEVSISPVLKDEPITNTEFLKICNDALTILPQNKSGKYDSCHRKSETQAPDILTIVPQTNPTRSLSSSVTDPPHIITASGKVTPDASQVVKLVLLPSKESAMSCLESSCNNTLSDSPQKLKSLLMQGKNMVKMEESHDDDSEESDDGMVIDCKEEPHEEVSMDPLSMCAVTMEDEMNDGHLGQQQTNNESKIPDTSKSNALSSGENTREGDEESCVVKKKSQVKVDEAKYQRRKYVCKYCQKRFGWSTDLKRHIILHTGERPFKCKWCPINFTRKFLMQNHMKRMHPLFCKWSDLWE